VTRLGFAGLGALGEALIREVSGVRGLEVVAVLDHLSTEAAHRRVLVRAVAVRHDDRHPDAGGSAGERQALPMVSAGRGDHPSDQRPLFA
jgi:predicted homoserine dehydrogenase-like protein